MDKDGYIILKGVVDHRKGLRCFNGDALDYTCMRQFIEGDMLPPGFTWTKFRVSDKTNSVDASVFHRDIIPLRNAKVIESFTVLTYLDQSDMEIIPGSHKKLHMNPIESLTSYKTKRITLYPGDVMIFYSTLIHRGIFTGKQDHRRLVQVFECYDTNLPPIGHVKAKNTGYANTMVRVSEIPILIDIISFFEYLNSSQGYGLNQVDKFMYLSSEGLAERIEIVPETYQPLNKYVTNGPLTDYDESYFKFNFYYRQYLLYIGVLVLFVLLINKIRVRMTRKR